MTTLLQKLEEAAKAATPGPWFADQDDETYWVETTQAPITDTAHFADAAYIELVQPKNILALCERERQRDALLVELVDVLDSVATQVHSIKLSTVKGKNINRCETIIENIEESLGKAASFTAKDARL